MITIRLTAAFQASSPEILQDPGHYTLSVGSITKVLIPSMSAINPADPARAGGQFQVLLRPDEEFSIEPGIFETLVENAQAGGDVSFLSRLLYLVGQGVVEVVSAGAPMTVRAILDYQAP